MIIDAHTHAYGENIAARTMSRLEAIIGHPPAYDGTVEGLRAAMAGNGVTHAIMLAVATKPSQHGTINAWAASENRGNITAFGSVHPGCEDPCAELQRIKDLGLMGLKVHPDYQLTFSDDPGYYAIYEGAQALGLVVEFHCGIDSSSRDLVHNPPRNMKKIRRDFPRLRMIGAHLGGLLQWEEVYEELAGLDLYLECSLTHRGDPALIRRILDKHSPDRVLFGSDGPWGSQTEQIDYIRALGLPADREEKLFYRNAADLLGLRP